MKDLDFNNGTISILKGVISGFLIAYLIVLGLRPAAEYPDNLLEIIDNPWIFVVLVLINFYVMQWDTTIGLLMLLSIIALMLDIFIFTGGEIFSNDVETFKSENTDKADIDMDEDENYEEDEEDKEASKDAKKAKEVEEEASKDAKKAKEVEEEASEDTKIAKEVDEEAPKDAKIAKEVDEEAPDDVKVASKDVRKAKKKPEPKEDSRYEDKPSSNMSKKVSDKKKLIKDIQEKFNSLVNILS